MCGGGSKKQKVTVKRGDLDGLRLRKDELRKHLDADFATLGTRIGRLRTEPLGLDRDGREFFLLGGPSEGQQPLADFSRLLVRRRSPAAPADADADADAASAPPSFVDEWVCVGSPDELQALLASLRVGGVREGNLHKSLTTLQPLLDAAMAPPAPAAAADDCGVCENCLDKPKFGGPGTKRKMCVVRAEEARPRIAGLWERGGWCLYSSRVVELKMGAAEQQSHAASIASVEGGRAASSGVARAAKRQLLEIHAALRLTGLTGLPQRWAPSVAAARTLSDLHELFFNLAKAVPPERYKEGWRTKVEEGEASAAPTRDELRRELRTGRERPLCAVVGLPADRDPTDDDKPPRVETYHQLLLHIHVLDAALNFNG